jgi:acetate---CoA ligase (ADP-forming)
MIERLFGATSIAFVGASPRSALLSGMATRLKVDGFPGPIWMINPNRDTVFGYPAYPSLAALPAIPDLIVVAVRATMVAQVLAEAAGVGVRAAIVVSTGFADAGAEGMALLGDVQRAAREHGIALNGPGAFGFAAPHAHLTPFCGGNDLPLPAGNIAVVAQSGGFANILALAALERGFGFSYLVATGSEGILNASDFLRYVVEDERTKVVIAVLEEIRDVPGLREALIRAAELRKPVLVLPLGRSEAGQRATSAHSGALATRTDIQDAFLRELGAVVVTTVDDCIETALLAAALREPLPDPVRPLIVTISGGDCSLVLDLASDAGIETPTLPASMQEQLHAVLPDSTMLFNPLDLGTRPLTEPDIAGTVLETAAADPGVNLILTRLFGGPADFRGVAEAANRSGKPHVVFTRAALAIDPQMLEVSRATGTPILQGIDRALGAVERLLLASVAREKSLHRAPALASAVFENPRRRFGDRLSEADGLLLLKEAGVPVVELRPVTNSEEAFAAARELGYPLAVKVDSADIEHKSDIGGVKLNIASDGELRAAIVAIAENVQRARPDARVRGILLQRMMRAPVELILGCVPDDRFGTAVFVGFGGLLAESLGRPQFCMAPVDEAGARAAIERLLSPKRGGAMPSLRKLDIEAAARAFAWFSDFAVKAAPYLEAIEVNPLGVFTDGGGAVALDALLLLRPVTHE